MHSRRHQPDPAPPSPSYIERLVTRARWTVGQLARQMKLREASGSETPKVEYSPAAVAGLAQALCATAPRPYIIPIWRIRPQVAIWRKMLEENTYQIQHHRSVRLDPPITWREDPFNDRNWRFWFHAFSAVSYLVQGYQATAEPPFLARAEELVESWIKTCMEQGWNGPGVWDDHGSALRAMCLLYFWEVRRAVGIGNELARRLLATLIAHARVLAEESFYQPAHNHGIEQDRALLAIALNLAEWPEAGAWEELARTRLARQIHDTISGDGVHLEHTPDYHHHVYVMLAQTDAFLKEHGRPWSLLEETTAKMLRYLTNCLKPGGEWPNIGDTTPGGPVNLAGLLRVQKTDAPEFFYAYTSAAEGRMPAERDLVLPGSGVAIFRETWDADRAKTAVQLQFSAAFNSRVHKHHDDLSFVLHGFGHDLLVDGGKFKYDYQDPRRQFCESSYAHNVVVREGHETDLRRARIGRSGIIAALPGRNVSVVAGAHELLRGFIVRRLLIWVRPAIIAVIDRVSPAATGFRQLFNVGPDLSVQEMSGQVIARTPDGSAGLRICPAWPASPTIALARGQEAPLRGWISRQHAKLEPTTSFFIDMDPHAGVGITLIALEYPERPVRAFTAAAELTGTHGVRVSWTLNGEEGELRAGLSSSRAKVSALDEVLEGPVLPLPYKRGAAGTNGAGA